MSAKVSNLKKNSMKIDFLPVATKEQDDSNQELLEQDDTSCGIGSFRPTILQKLNNPKIFLINHSILGVLQGAFFTYLVGCLSTLEKRFAYESKVTGLIMISDEISPILFGLLLGYFGGKSHRPRIVAAGMVIAVLSCFVMSLPYFIYGPILHENTEVSQFIANKTRKEEFCDYSDKNYLCKKSPTFTAVSLFFFGNFLKGFGSLAFYTIGTSFLDDSVKKKNSPVYFGTLFALRLLGPTVGFLLSSLCLQFYEDPFYDPGFGTRDPRWVGAWWLGFIILGVAIFIFSIPMILFPKRFPKKKIPSSLLAKKQEDLKTPIEQLKDMGKAMKRLIRNPILTCHYLGGVLRLNGIVGYYVLLPKYMEMQFRQSASKASLYSGPASIIGMQLGILLGGISIRKFRPRPRVLTGGIVIAETFTVLALIGCMIITCPVDNMAGTTTVTNPLFDLQNTCNEDCKCTTKVYTPVCGPDGKSTYFSPCFAGCTGYNKTGKKEVFTNCKCVHNEEGEFTLGDVNKSYCGFECQWMVTFVVILSLGKLMSSTARVGNALVTLRCVDPEDKSIALGASSGIFSLLAFIPYPLIYGALTDASCLVWEKSCGKTGNCWVYDTDKFRYLLHGVSAAFVFLGCLTDVLVWVLSPRLRNLYDDDDDEYGMKKEKTAEEIAEAEIINNGGVLGVVKTGIMNGSVHSLDEKPSSPQQ